MNSKGFKIKFDKNTIDHLGVKLYSSFPPVIAELISNSFDSDAENVKIKINYNKKEVTVIDDGSGMNHDELNRNFLVIGRNRRLDEKTGFSKKKNRKVTGKKGLGKLAVFGIANIIEVYSIKDGLKNAFSINYTDMKTESNEQYEPKVIYENKKTDEPTGTIIKIKDIRQTNITNIENLASNLTRRFSFFDVDFKVKILDEESNIEQKITKSIYFDNLKKEFEWEFPRDFEEEIYKVKELKRLKEKGIEGKIFTKSTPLKKKDSGFLLYVRKKLASENIFFDERSNDIFNSYVTGYFNIDYIDESMKEDYISTSRQSILWEEKEELSQLKRDLNKLVLKVAYLWKSSRKKKKEELIVLNDSFFSGLTPVEKRNINEIKNTLIKNSPEINDIGYFKRILNSIRNIYKFESFQEFLDEIKMEDLTLDMVEKITSDWEYIECKELAKVAIGRIKAIDKFEKFVKKNESETKVIQPFLEKFPWILNPRITTFEREKKFSSILKEEFPDEKLKGKDCRIDFLCNLVNDELMIIELKRPGIKITNRELDQALDYVIFIKDKYKFKKIITYLISDRYEMSERTKMYAGSLEKTGDVYIKSYSDLLREARQFNKEFIKKHEEIEKKQSIEENINIKKE